MMRLFAAVATALVFLFSAPTIAQTTAAKVAAEVGPSTVYISDLNDIGHGSGFAFAPFMVMTAEHVVHSHPDDLIVSDKTGQRWYATVVWSDDKIDMAVLKLKQNKQSVGPKPMQIDCDHPSFPSQGQEVLMFGNPSNLKFIAQRGMIASDEAMKYQHWTSGYLINALITPGISGGPMYVDGVFSGILTGRTLVLEGRGRENVTDFGFAIDKLHICRALFAHDMTSLVMPVKAPDAPVAAAPAPAPVPEAGAGTIEGMIVIVPSSSDSSE